MFWVLFEISRLKNDIIHFECGIKSRGELQITFLVVYNFTLRKYLRLNYPLSIDFVPTLAYNILYTTNSIIMLH